MLKENGKGTEVLNKNQVKNMKNNGNSFPLNTEIVEESFLHEKKDKDNPNKYAVSAFSFRQGALWFKSMIIKPDVTAESAMEGLVNQSTTEPMNLK